MCYSEYISSQGHELIFLLVLINATNIIQNDKNWGVRALPQQLYIIKILIIVH